MTTTVIAQKTDETGTLRNRSAACIAGSSAAGGGGGGDGERGP